MTTTRPTPSNPLGVSTDTIKRRITSIDIMRGLVMLIMLVDHVRERIYYHQQVADPMDLDAVNPDLFFTRLLAHWCAPVFVFLTGLSAWLYAHPANKQPRSASGFLFKRGLFLLLLEVTLVNFSWFGSYNILYLQVMWAIGISMIVLAAAIKLPFKLVGLIGALIVFGHNALVPISFSPGEAGYALWTMLHERGMLIADGPLPIRVSYPVLPWIGLMMLGYFAGPLYGATMTPAQRKRQLIVIGVSCLSLLLVLRGFNIYGEILPWAMADTLVGSMMAFLNFTKYGPSLDFMLLTIGSSMFLLVLFEDRDNKTTEVLKTFGSAPMFFYLLHLYALLVLYAILMAIFGGNQGDLFGVDYVWQVWLVAVILSWLLYYPTKAFARFKHSSQQAWVKYF
ncbi:hypothetical protein SIN8267_02665 [Sinobacterium norvegicum]|uniref:Heparan-alpha-glucosaminide N-acetyltransferase catalytic domain-containing protein n=1 Tax=Sinobacterium norvegicum TaxID=1641715 RepID=A0ABM9AH37_9GAMM|nr:heparan-alpha-glucosaminide N-acetyltransferase domain-containing protein [Sinobacterium norvegicum]CAH0992532.1 hypothetical protein SIN8267_02665 [Sinobacterium norvegicum]